MKSPNNPLVFRNGSGYQWIHNPSFSLMFVPFTHSVQEVPIACVMPSQDGEEKKSIAERSQCAECIGII
jgi:hypothetical protein